jgi:lipoprotein-anchoring transpeptidase ErfK/SrfK
MDLRTPTQKMAPVEAVLLLLLLCSLTKQSFGFQASRATTSPVRHRSTVVVSIPDRKLAVIADGKIRRVFVVSVGAAASPSPTGHFQITNRIANPTYYHPGVVVPAGQNNPLGPRWIGLNKKSYGIHGTNVPRSIGKAASHGCIRLRNADVIELYSMLAVGDTVEIHGERDAATQHAFDTKAVSQTRIKVAAVAASTDHDRS